MRTGHAGQVNTGPGALRRMSRTAPYRKGERGAATVEFAVIAAFLLLILFGILEFGLLFWQNHFVANAAREGLRVGVVANNYLCFNGDPADGCNSATDRFVAVDTTVREYLGALYRPEDIVTLDIESPESGNSDADRKPLSVTIEVRNFYPSIIAAFVPGYDHPDTLIFTATGDYENPQEP